MEAASAIQWKSKDIFNSVYSGEKKKNWLSISIWLTPQLLYYPVRCVYSKAFLTLKEKDVCESELRGVKLIFCPQQEKKTAEKFPGQLLSQLEYIVDESRGERRGHFCPGASRVMAQTGGPD